MADGGDVHDARGRVRGGARAQRGQQRLRQRKVAKVVGAQLDLADEARRGGEAAVVRRSAGDATAGS